ncbi:hypothetical protein J2Z76_002696 [Sedimentibacter acidaminivorans]|uniref:PIN like domain-containing protein n=1 Tax=Sedimentibacter acidaminivorans TaxID=913099 RepID=A0ABS4GGK6_9FIRM|nr:PIN domain-containing protein [Sedimentibacter acidaminivorans]MBP1926826.1 hypothetical protein [Sedimentibacter acidaminivorans]
MKNIMREFLEPSNKEKQELWDNCVFVFDTNTLLNLYRYSSNTRNTLINALEYLKDRIWMPYHVAYEFMKNRCEVIYETSDHYNKMIQEKNKFKDTIANALRIKNMDSDLIELDKFINDWIEKQKKQNLIVVNHGDDYILNKLLDLFDNRTGEPNCKDKLAEIEKEGKNRYEKLIPPGYKDSGKKNNVSDNNMYGDLIIWNQILEYSKNNNKNIIYITDDQKEDWWNIVKGKTIGTRVELVKEFIKSTDQQFYMYSMDSFLRMYEKQSRVKVDKKTIDEVLEMNRKPKIKFYNSSKNVFDYGIPLEALKETDLFDKLSDLEKLEIINYIKENKLKIQSDNKQFYIICPRCNYQGYSNFENECPECRYVWCE